MWKYNKGEWSELYTFVYLLQKAKLYSADEHLQINEEEYFPLISIIREEQKGDPIYYKTGEVIKIYQNGQLLKEVSKKSFEDMAIRLFEYIPKGSRAFEISGTEEFFKNIYCNKVKATSNQKEDITVELKDIYTGIKAIRGFSIKSFLGSAPTLINAGTNTNFTYVLEDCNDQIMKNTNNIQSSQKIKDRIGYLLESGCSFIPEKHSISKQFEENLIFIDTLMPDILQLLVLYHYTEDKTNVSDVVKILEEKNPLKYSNVKIYAYKIKKLLCAWALGLTPERNDWEGVEDANGGYITVRSDGEIACYHLYNRAAFEDYLFNYSRFERASTSRYGYLSVYKEDGLYRIKLNLQIRFRSPAARRRS